MCGRYVAEEDTSLDLGTLYRAVRVEYPHVSLRSGEIFPTNTVPILAGKSAVPRPAAWGLPGFDGKGTIINARAETAAEKPTFRQAFRVGRCIVPATGYYEWDSAKQKHLFSPLSGSILYMAGLCRMTPVGIRFVILTTASVSVPSAAAIHHRMPVLLSQSTMEAWMGDTAVAARLLQVPGVQDIPLQCTRVV